MGETKVNATSVVVRIFMRGQSPWYHRNGESRLRAVVLVARSSVNNSSYSLRAQLEIEHQQHFASGT